jgi:hypothetical protein
MGFIDFTAGQVLTADQMDLVMRQSVMVFDDAAARNSALSGITTKGMVTYLSDVNRVEKFDGTNFVSLEVTSLPATSIDYTLVTDSDTSVTLTSSEAKKYLRLTSNDTVLTVSTDTDFEVGDQVTILADGENLEITTDGATIAGAGVTTTSGTFAVGAQYEAVSILCVDSDEYRIIGNISEVTE